MTSPKVHISWQAGAPPPELDEADLRAGVAAFLRLLGRDGAAVNLLLGDDALLRELNARHRGRDEATDILSWSYGEEGEVVGESEPEPLFGEMAVSLERGRAQAAENGWPLRTELLRLLAHGCAHLAGYDHQTDGEEREMRAVEIRMLAGIGLEGLYPEI